MSISEKLAIIAANEQKVYDSGYEKGKSEGGSATNKLAQVIDRSVTEITAEDLAGVTEIGSYAFNGCKSLVGVTIPDNVTHIKEQAFRYCTALITLVLSNNITSIGISSFSDCTSLKDITMPDSITSIGQQAFSYCRSITNVVIPNSVMSIALLAFSGCTKLTSIRIGNGINIMQSNVFKSCPALTDIYIDKEEGSISDSPWGATNATIHWNTPLPSLGYSINEDGQSYSVNGPGTYGTDITHIVIPNTYEGLPVIGIDNSAFEGVECITSVIIPNSVTSIGKCAFMHCNNLTSVTIPNSVTNIGDNAFSYCDSLTSVTIPDSVTKIGNNAFSMCNKLTDIYIYALPESISGSPWGATDAQIHWIMGD